MYGTRALVWALPVLVTAQKPQFPPAFPPTPILPMSVNYAPSVTPNVLDTTAPNAQDVCSGYKASNVVETSNSLIADLSILGDGCNVYGNDIADLLLSVEYQAKERLSVRIYPKHLAPSNHSQYILSPHLTPQPSSAPDCSKDKSDLSFEWTNDPSFQFRVSRVTSGEVIFDTYGHKLVFEDQFLELVTNMVPDYNIYGLAASIHGFRLGNNWTQTFWNAYNLDNDQEIDVNGHDTHPVYLETRYGDGKGNSSSPSTSHGVYARNAHGQDWLLRNDRVVYRTIGGSFDLYFLSGPTPKEVIAQYHTGIVGTPGLQPYWALGFHQCRWYYLRSEPMVLTASRGYLNWTNLQEVIDLYAQADIQLEGIMSDLDYLYLNRIFTHNANYDVEEGRKFLARLHANGQYWLPILDPNVYVPDPTNASDAFATYDRGKALDLYIKNGDEDYVGTEWPGFSVWPDFTADTRVQQYWTDEFKRYFEQLEYDGWWLDISDPASWCTGSCGSGKLELNPVHIPIQLPGDANTSVAVDYRYPEFFNVTNSTEAASASAALASQSAAYPTPSVTPTPVYARTLPTPGVRNLNFPPYAINNFLDGHSLVKQVISPNATHNDGPYNSTEYELHNLYGHASGNVSYNALVATHGGKRPFFLARSTFAGSGTFAGTWGGDTNSMWGNMYFGISQALAFGIAGIPYFGVETCGFNGNADMELCTRWMQLSAWFPFYRNHNNRNTIAQEAYRWADTAESTRRIMNIRYSLLPYTYTLFHKAHEAGETVLRALAWEFPNDPQLAGIDNQFMSGPALLITPVLAPLATTVRGVFPGVAEGTRWYDWYTLDEVHASPGENKTLEAPLLHQPIFVRGGYILPIQKAGNTTKTSRLNPWSLIVALDKDGKAEGSLYLDDGINIVQEATKEVTLSYANNTLHATVSGEYNDHLPLANVTIVGVEGKAGGGGGTVTCGHGKGHAHTGWGAEHGNGESGVQSRSENGVVYITGLESATKGGVWNEDLEIIVG